LGHNDREKVVRRQGVDFAFSLPHGHTLDIRDEPDEETGRPLAHIGIPGVGGEVCRLLDLKTREDELEYVLEPAGGEHSVGNQPEGYPWPRVQDEHARLRARWESAGGDLSRFDAWAKGASIESHFGELRAELRKLAAANG